MKKNTVLLTCAVAIVVLGAGGVLGVKLGMRKLNNTINDRIAAATPAQKSDTDLEHRVQVLERLAANQPVPSPAGTYPLASEYQGIGAEVFSLFDGVGPYRKNGLLEVYGAALRERRNGPISVTEADLEISHDEAWTIWSPDFSPAQPATHLEVEFAELPKSGSLTVGFILSNGSAGAFTAQLGTPTAAPAGLLPPLVPADFLAQANMAQRLGTLPQGDKKLLVALPPVLLAALRANGDTQIAQWFLKINGAAGTTWRFRHVSLIRPAPRTTVAALQLSGRVDITGLAPDAKVELLDESGAATSLTPALDGGFMFADLPPGKPVSVRVFYRGMYHYPTLGRWIVPTYSRDDLLIKIRPLYVNADAHPADQSKAKFVGPRVPSTVGAVYEPHARQYWPGSGKVQEFDTTTFTNNHGFLDRDRFFDNPDQCIRIASTGGSDMVALQVRAFEKSNILLEEALGVALKRCVEVISAGADNGDLGTNYGRIRDYTSKFKVDYTLVSAAQGLMQQVSPTMLRDGLGFDPENSALPNFYFKKNGEFAFRDASPAYPVFMTEPTRPEYAKGLPFSQTLAVPFEVMPSQGKEAFQYWKDIMAYINKNNPGQNLILHSGVDQAQCRANCDTTTQVNGQQTVRSGAAQYVRNLVDFCAQNQYTCVQPQFPGAAAASRDLLTFEFDGHYSPRGHQWLARELAAPMTEIISARSR